MIDTTATVFMRRLTLTIACCAAAVALSSGNAAASRASVKCAIPGNGENLGPTYLNALSVTGTTCTTGLAVVRTYHDCQLQRGGVKATCSSPVDGFRCVETRGPSIPTEFYSTVSCSDHAKRVHYKYSQFT
jgi:hypothetical protein